MYFSIIVRICVYVGTQGGVSMDTINHSRPSTNKEGKQYLCKTVKAQ